MTLDENTRHEVFDAIRDALFEGISDLLKNLDYTTKVENGKIIMHKKMIRGGEYKVAFNCYHDFFVSSRIILEKTLRDSNSNADQTFFEIWFDRDDEGTYHLRSELSIMKDGYADEYEYYFDKK